MSYRIHYTCVSHPGKVRPINQDNFICNGQFLPLSNSNISFPIQGSCDVADSPIFGVFDGMGGEQHGEVAALIAARHAAVLTPHRDGIETLRFFCEKANHYICNYSAEKGVSSTGTTAAMLLYTKKNLCLCNIGDSRIFRFREGTLEQLSVDHLCVAPFGVKAPLSQNLGISPKEMRIDPYFHKFSYNPGDLYLICSDGLTDMVTNEKITEILSSASLDSATAQLLDLALENGGKDNITLILCRVEKESQWPFSKKNNA